MNNFDEALVRFREIRSKWQDVPPSEPTAQRHLVSQLAELACKENRVRAWTNRLGEPRALGGRMLPKDSKKAACQGHEKGVAGAAWRRVRLAAVHGLAAAGRQARDRREG